MIDFTNDTMKAMRLAWCVDDNVRLPLQVAIETALRRRKPGPGAIHVVTAGLSADFVGRLRVLCSRHGAAEFDIVGVDADRIAGLQRSEWISRETCKSAEAKE